MDSNPDEEAGVWWNPDDARIDTPFYTDKDEYLELLCGLFSFSFSKDRIILNRGVTEVDESVVKQICGSKSIEVNVKTKQLLKVDGVRSFDVMHHVILDLSVDGDRWEGDVLDDTPWGWGVLYDKNGNKVYEGFQVGEKSVCYGRSFNPTTERLSYEGGFCEGDQWGKGVQYDQDGAEVYSGEWLNGLPLETHLVVNSNEDGVLHNHVEVLSFSSRSCNDDAWKTFDLSPLSVLTELRIDDNSFQNVTDMRLVGMGRLSTVLIGENCFSNGGASSNDGEFVVKDCPALKRIVIQNHSFSRYATLQIKNAPSLEEIDIHDHCFGAVHHFTLSDFDRLKRVSIGADCFRTEDDYESSGEFHLKECYEIETLEVGALSFEYFTVCEIASVSLKRLQIGSLESDFCRNFCFASLELKNLLSLEHVVLGEGSFCYCSRALFENLPQLASIHLGYNALSFDDGDSELVMQDLPLLATLVTEDVDSESLHYPRHITLENMPSLIDIVLPSAFACRDDLRVSSECLRPSLTSRRWRARQLLSRDHRRGDGCGGGGGRRADSGRGDAVVR